MPKTILIADTNEISRDLLKKILSNTYPLIILESPSHALKVIGEKKKPALVFMGTNNSLNADGENIFAAMRKQEPSLIIIALGDQNEEDEAIEAVRKGASGYIIKPLNPHEIMSMAAKSAM